MKERIFTTKEQGRALVEAGLPISTASGFRNRYLDRLHSMEDEAGRIGLIEVVTPDAGFSLWRIYLCKGKKSSNLCNDRLEVIESYRRRRGGDRQREIPSIRNRVRS